MKNRYFQSRIKNNRWRKFVNVLCCLAVFCTTYALILPAITMEQTVYCEQEEHSAHTEECYTVNEVLVCTEEHEHTADCYCSEEVLLCEKPLHVHSEECCIDHNADKETKAEWEASISTAELTGDLREDLVYVAETQLGYTESSVNYTVEDGENHGYTRYGEWYGEPYAEWSGMFASFCMHYAKTELPEAKDCTELKNAFAAMGLYVSAGNYEPMKGDIVFLDTDHDDVLDHTGIIRNTEDELQIIIGDYENKVSLLSYAKNDMSIKGYGLLEPAETEELTVADEEENEVSDDAETAEIEMDKAEDISSAGTVSASSANGKSKAKAMLLSDTDPINVSDYIVAQNDGAKTQLLFKKGDGEWQTVNGDTEIPGDATLHLDVVYERVKIDQLIAAGGQLTYDVPDFMRNPVAQGAIMDGNTQVGTIDVQNGKAVITFNQSFLAAQKANNQSLLAGTFFIESTVDITNVSVQNPDKLIVGDVEIELKWEDELIAKYGNVEINKSSAKYSEDEDGHPYLTYTLNVTAGADGCPDVKVEDRFSDSSKPVKNIDSYVGINGTVQSIANISEVTETVAPEGNGGSVYLGTVTTAGGKTVITPAGNNAQTPGTLIWDIGDMAPNEVRTLTYKVKLSDSYIGVQKKENLLNSANVYSDGYSKDSDQTTFAPKAGMNERKTAAEPVENDDGTYTITYTVWVKANTDNTYTLTNVKICDSLNHYANRTEEKYLDTLEYDPDSFTLHNGGNSSAPVMAPINNSPVFNDDNYGFTYYVGDMAPGEERTLT